MTLGALRHTAAISLLQAVVETAQIALWLGTPMLVTRPHRQRRERAPTSSASVTGDTRHRHGTKYNSRSSGRSLTCQSGASCPTASKPSLMTSSDAMPRVHKRFMVLPMIARSRGLPCTRSVRAGRALPVAAGAASTSAVGAVLAAVVTAGIVLAAVVAAGVVAEPVELDAEPDQVIQGSGIPSMYRKPRVRPLLGVVAGDRQLPAARPSKASSPSLRRIVLTSGARSSPSTRPSAAGGTRVAPSARLAQQRQEHQQHQHRLQPVEPVLQPAVHVPGCLDRPGAGQGGQRQQQPGQRIPRPRREHRRGALPEQPVPGQRPLPVPRHRAGQHRQLILRPGGLPAGRGGVPAGRGGGAPGAGRRAGTRPSAVRTANVDTPAAAAIAAWDFPAAASSLILPVSSGVSLDGPFGPACPPPARPARRAGTHPATATASPRRSRTRPRLLPDAG